MRQTTDCVDAMTPASTCCRGRGRDLKFSNKIWRFAFKFGRSWICQHSAGISRHRMMEQGGRLYNNIAVPLGCSNPLPIKPVCNRSHVSSHACTCWTCLFISTRLHTPTLTLVHTSIWERYDAQRHVTGTHHWWSLLAVWHNWSLGDSPNRVRIWRR